VLPPPTAQKMRDLRSPRISGRLEFSQSPRSSRSRRSVIRFPIRPVIPVQYPSRAIPTTASTVTSWGAFILWPWKNVISLFLAVV